MKFGMAVMLLGADHVDITHEQKGYYPIFFYFGGKSSFKYIGW
jgi:hypothetical protein